jgi:hypothetical protein
MKSNVSNIPSITRLHGISHFENYATYIKSLFSIENDYINYTSNNPILQCHIF